ncbi:MAG TPA: serine/threonine protein kinase [Sorangium sp.]|nr:serine/threonine protein kinase [Sorangium sp.]
MRQRNLDENSCDLIDQYILEQAAAAPNVAVQPAAAAPDLVVGDVVADAYRVEGLIGRGGMGVVYEATDLMSGRRVALKLSRPDSAALDPAAQARLMVREARAIARVSDHANIVTFFHAGYHHGRAFIAQELLQGCTLAQRLRTGPLSLSVAMKIVDGLLAGLAAAHQAGVQHRDIKPRNVFLTNEGGVRVIDFGLATIAHTGGWANSGGKGLLGGGTPAYMAPEQWAGKRGDARSDVYSAALLLLECVTGRLALPSSDRTSPNLVSRLREALPNAPARLEVEIDRALSHAPNDRHRDAGELRQAFAKAWGGDGAWARLRARLPSVKLSAVAAVVLFAVVLALALALWSAEVSRLRAQRQCEQWSTQLEGVWQATHGMGQVVLTQTGPNRLHWVGEGNPRLKVPRLDVFRNEGEVTVELGEKLIIKAELVDTPGWCCGNEIYKEGEVVGPHEIVIYRNDYSKVDGSASWSRPSLVYRLRREVGQ